MLSAQHGARPRLYGTHRTPVTISSLQVRPVRASTGSRTGSPAVKVSCYLSAEEKAPATQPQAGSVHIPRSNPAAMMPPASWRRPYSPGPLTETEFEQYWEQGYVIKRGLLTQDDIDPCLRAIERWASCTFYALRTHHQPACMTHLSCSQSPAARAVVSGSGDVSLVHSAMPGESDA